MEAKKAVRLMPDKMRLGQHMMSTIGHSTLHWRNAKESSERTVMGFRLPSWQRPLVWTEEQKVRFIESAWLGLNLGTYSYTQTRDPEFDGLLIDGQQRMWALECYLSDAFPVFGYRYSELTDADHRCFEMSTTFACYIINSNDEKYLREYYNMMNFGGTPHKETERA